MKRPGSRHRARRVAALAAGSALLALSSPPPTAPAAVTIGNLAPGTPSTCGSANTPPADLLQPTSTGNTYVVTGAGTIISWSTRADATAGDLYTMKLFRLSEDPTTFRAVAHDGPHPLTAGTVNTFPANVPVHPGDILGFNSGPGQSGCFAPAPGDSYLSSPDSNLADGAKGSFTASRDFRLNIAAVIEPSNAFKIRGVSARNRRSGKARLKVNLPGPGELSIRRGGTRRIDRRVDAAGVVQLLVQANKRRRDILDRTGVLAVRPKITYRPTGGNAAARRTKLRLLKDL
jgi:hypothetical protein